VKDERGGGDGKPVPRDELGVILERDLEKIYPRLLYFARRYTGPIRYFGDAAWEPNDLADEAITRLLEGRRKWYREKCPDLTYFLCRVIESIASSRCRGLAKHEFSEYDEQKNNEVKPTTGAYVELPPNPEDEALARGIYNEHKRWVATEFKDDEEVRKVVECLDAGYTEPRDIADLTNMPVKKIYTVLQRYHRHLDKVRDRIFM